MNDTPQLRAFKVKFLGPTNHKGARITITEPSATRFDSIRSRRTFSYDYAIGDVLKQGIEELFCMGFNVQGYAQTESGDTYTILCDNWGEEWLDLNGSKEYQELKRTLDRA